MAHQVKWFDLSRFGAALRVIPKSPLRGIAITCLEIRDHQLYQRMIGWPTANDNLIDKDKRQSLRESLRQAKQTLGFSEQPQIISVEIDGPKRYFRYFSTQTEFSLSQLRTLFPGLNSNDLRDVPVSEIRLEEGPFKGVDDKWSLFTEQVLSIDNKKVWTPIINPFDMAFSESGSILDADPTQLKKPFSLLIDNQIPIYCGLADKLHRSNYRQNSLIPFYVDLSSAIEDGWQSKDLQQVDLPYAAPLWITQEGKIIALKDIRYAPEIMDVLPVQYYGIESGGLIVSPIRSAKPVKNIAEKEIENWKIWGVSPETLENSNMFFESLNKVVSAIHIFEQQHPHLAFASGRLTNENVIKDGTLNKSDMYLLAMTVNRFVPLTSKGSVELTESLKNIFDNFEKSSKNQKENHVDSNKKESETSILNNNITDSEKLKHIDVGEKIGGARKDYARRSMMIEDLETMNEMERKTYVLKKNVWPALNYSYMRENGVTAQAAIAIKYLKDSINVTPNYQHHLTTETTTPEIEYIRAISTIRDEMSKVNTLDDFKEACINLLNVGRGDKKDSIYGHSPFQVTIGYDTCNLLSSAEYRRSWDIDAPTMVMVPRKIEREIRKRENRVAGWGKEATEEQLWETLIKPKQKKSEAEKETEKNKTEQERELHRPHLDKVERLGTDFRHGRDIVADDLLEHFGFRGIEFGNWLPQDERQQVLNMAFDSLYDLSEALDIPPRALSFDGELAIAFGSRGRGGKFAALAHFEPTRFVINLTRINGAGSLAHEWMHALDFHLGERKSYASEQYTNSQKTIIRKLSEAMKSRQGSVDEILNKTTSNARRGATNAVSWLYSQSDNTKERLKNIIESLYQKTTQLFTEQAKQKIEAIKETPSFYMKGIAPSGVISLETQNNAKEEIIKILRQSCDNKSGFTKVKEKIESNVRYMLDNIARACTVRACSELQIKLPQSFCDGSNNRCTTDFYEQARQLDKNRNTPYWATTHELFARAGAAYIHDKLEVKGIRNDYLVYGSDEQRYAEHPNGNPNPVGCDREILAVHFNNLIDEYRLNFINNMKKESSVGMEM